MRIGGLQKFTLIDYPGKMAAIIFTQGCNFRCGYCYNPQLVIPERFGPTLPEHVIMEFLESRRGQLEGVVVTGGEPTIQQGLTDFLIKLKDMDYAVKLDTNGSNPHVLEGLIQAHLIDYVAMDIKTSLAHYNQATGVKVDGERIRASIDLIVRSRLPHHFRTTLVKCQSNRSDLKVIQQLIGPSSKYVLQPFVAAPQVIDSRMLSQVQYTSREVEELRGIFQRRT